MRTPLDEYLASWQVHMRAAGKAPATIRSYAFTIEAFGRWLADNDLPVDPCRLHRRDIEAFLASSAETMKQSTVRTRWIALKALYRWLDDEDEMDGASPMLKVVEPLVPTEPIALLSERSLADLLSSTAGKGFGDRRDNAIIRVCLDSGVRVGELVGMMFDDVHMDTGTIVVRRGKGGSPRVAAVGPKTTQALDRYRRARSRHRHANLPNLWLGQRGGLTIIGVQAMFTRRGRALGIEGLHPHALRHFFAHSWLSNGGSEGDLMKLGGWTNPEVMRHYGSAAAVERALDAHKRLSPGERF